MKKVWMTALAVGLLMAMASTAEAWCGRKSGCCDQPCCETQVTYVDKVVTCYRPKLVEKEIQCVINRVTCHEVVEERKINVCIPVWNEEKREITVCRMVPREVEREVTCVRKVPVCVTDPCTGCTRTTYKCETYTQKVKTTVCEAVQEKKEVVVKVCSFKTEERTVQCKRLVAECKPETVTKKICTCVMEPYTTTIKVAVCTPVCAPACK